MITNMKTKVIDASSTKDGVVVVLNCEVGSDIYRIVVNRRAHITIHGPAKWGDQLDQVPSYKYRGEMTADMFKNESSVPTDKTINMMIKGLTVNSL